MEGHTGDRSCVLFVFELLSLGNGVPQDQLTIVAARC